MAHEMEDRVHPRVSGVLVKVEAEWIVLKGSSPRERGFGRYRFVGDTGCRFIPA